MEKEIQIIEDALTDIKKTTKIYTDDDDTFSHYKGCVKFRVESALTALEQLKEGLEWQPIETALKTGVQILIYYKNDCNVGRTIKAKYVPKFTEESDEEFDEEFTEYSEEADEYYTPEGWYEMIDN